MSASPVPRRRALRVLRIVVVVAVILLGGTAVAGYVLLRHLDHGLKSVDLPYRPHRPPPQPDALGRMPLNILVLGTTSRTGNAEGVPGGDHDNQSDTIMLVHVSADRSWASVVSLPRDLMVHIPSCQRGNATTAEHQADQINNAFEYGGPACSIATIEGFTDLRIDHFVEIDFQGFKNFVNALGGVQVCLPKPVNDDKSGLHLAAGPQVIKGDTALAFVRTRYGLESAGLGDGGDLDRIHLQQQFVASLIRKLGSENLLLDPVKLYSVLDAATRSITTDTGLGSVTKLGGLARALADVPQGRVSFITVPNVAYPPDPNRLELAQPEADRLFTMLRQDQRPTAGSTRPSPSASTSALGTGVTGTVVTSAGYLSRTSGAAEPNPCPGFTAADPGAVQDAVDGGAADAEHLHEFGDGVVAA